MLVLLQARTPMSVPEIVERLRRRGSPIRSRRPHEAVRQALDREIDKGRVVRVSHGRYGAVGVPLATRYRWQERFPWLC